MAEVTLILVSFPNLGSKQKMNMNSQNTMASPYHSKVRFTKNRGVPLSSCLGHGGFVKGKVYPGNSLTCQTWLTFNLSMKTVNKLCVSDEVYNWFKKTFLLFHTALLKCFINSRISILDSPLVQQSLSRLPRIRSR